jgi:predicted Zn-dependent protease
MLQLPFRRVALCAVLLALAWTVAASSAAGPAKRPGKGQVLALVPVGASAERVAALDEIFRTELKLETAILPAIAPDPTALDKRRKQLVAEKLADQIRAEHRHLVSTGRVVVIGVTDQDMFARAFPKRGFAFSHRDSSSSIAVVSTFRMDPRNLGTGINDAVLQSRLRKMVAKNVGMLLYGLPASSDPHSLLFSGIDGVDELDFIDERFASSGLLPAQ